MTLVTLCDVGVAYDGYDALRHVNLQIDDRDFLGIIGPNGGGKTSLVKAILGTVPYSGSIKLAPELFRGRERLIGYMPQITNFDRAFPISVFEVVLSGLQGHHGFRTPYNRKDRNRALKLIENAGIAEVAQKPIGEISGAVPDPPRTERPDGNRHGLARHRNHIQRREGDRLRKPQRTQAQIQYPYTRTVAELRLSDSGDLARNNPTHRARTPPRGLLCRSRLTPAPPAQENAGLFRSRFLTHGTDG